MTALLQVLKRLAKVVLALVLMLLLVYATLPAWLPLGLQAWVNGHQGGTLLLDPDYPSSHRWTTGVDWRYPGGLRLKGRLQISYDWHSLSQSRLKDVLWTEVELQLSDAPPWQRLAAFKPSSMDALWQALGAPPFDSMSLTRARILPPKLKTASRPPAAKPQTAAVASATTPLPAPLPTPPAVVQPAAELTLHWQAQTGSALDISLCSDCEAAQPQQLFVLSGRWQGQDGSLQWQAPGASMRLSRSQSQRAVLQAELKPDSPLATGLIRAARLDLQVQQLGPLSDWMSLLHRLRAQGQFDADLRWLGQKLKLAAQLQPQADLAWSLNGSLRGEGQGFDLPQADLQLGIRFRDLWPELNLSLSGSALHWQGHLWQLTGQQFRFDLPWQRVPKRGDWFAVLSGRFKGQLASWQFSPFDLRGEVSVRNARQLRLEFGLGMKPAEFGQLSVRHDWSSGEGLMDVQLHWPDLEQKRLPAPSSLLANWPTSLQLERGELSVQSQWRWSNQFSSAPQLTVQASSLQGQWQRLPFELARLKYQYSPSLPIPGRSLWQLQQGKLGRELQLSPIDGQLYWPWWQDRSALYPLQLQAGFAGGQLLAQNTGVKGDGHGLDILAQNLDLAPMMTLAAQPELAGQGRLGGAARLEWNDNGWSLPRGRLVQQDSGRLLWNGDRTQWLSRGRQYLNLLTDFRFQQLTAQWERASEPLLVSVALQGSNPGYYRGQNMSLELGLGIPLRALLLNLR